MQAPGPSRAARLSGPARGSALPSGHRSGPATGSRSHPEGDRAWPLPSWKHGWVGSGASRSRGTRQALTEPPIGPGRSGAPGLVALVTLQVALRNPLLARRCLREGRRRKRVPRQLSGRAQQQSRGTVPLVLHAAGGSAVSTRPPPNPGQGQPLGMLPVILAPSLALSEGLGGSAPTRTPKASQQPHSGAPGETKRLHPVPREGQGWRPASGPWLWGGGKVTLPMTSSPSPLPPSSAPTWDPAPHHSLRRGVSLLR